MKSPGPYVCERRDTCEGPATGATHVTPQKSPRGDRRAVVDIENQYAVTEDLFCSLTFQGHVGSGERVGRAAGPSMPDEEPHPGFRVVECHRMGAGPRRSELHRGFDYNLSIQDERGRCPRSSASGLSGAA
jgi:hypothetical protein